MFRLFLYAYGIDRDGAREDLRHYSGMHFIEPKRKTVSPIYLQNVSLTKRRFKYTQTLIQLFHVGTH